MARHLRNDGHSVTIIATDAFGRLDADGEQGIVRVKDLRSARALRRLLRRGDLPIPGGTVEVPPTALLTKILVPDVNVITWLPATFLAVRRLLSRQSVDCLITSSPPDSTHLIGLLFGARRPPWIADFRDGWCFEPLRESFPTGGQRALDAWLEREVAQTADVVVGATRPIADDLRRRLEANAAYVPNGWDPDTAPSPVPVSNADKGAITLVYTGSFSGIRGSDPGPLLRALGTVQEKHGHRRLRLVVAGRLTRADRDLISRSGVSDDVEHVGVLERAEALALQRSADALVLLTSRATSEATGKIFEYLAAGRPIVALAEGNEAERIVHETNTGITVPPDDVQAIADALRRVVSGELEKSYSPRNVERYTYPSPARAMAELVEEAIDHRRSA
jgi:glycosyltransferase involved in cell wall biosynthesis